MNKTCETCKFWLKSQRNPALMICAADTNHLCLVGPTFYCANWEERK